MVCVDVTFNVAIDSDLEADASADFLLDNEAVQALGESDSVEQPSS